MPIYQVDQLIVANGRSYLTTPVKQLGFSLYAILVMQDNNVIESYTFFERAIALQKMTNLIRKDIQNEKRSG